MGLQTLPKTATHQKWQQSCQLENTTLEQKLQQDPCKTTSPTRSSPSILAQTSPSLQMALQVALQTSLQTA